MRLMILVNVAGIALVAAAIWQGYQQRVVAACVLALGALVVAFVRERF